MPKTSILPVDMVDANKMNLSGGGSCAHKNNIGMYRM